MKVHDVSLVLRPDMVTWPGEPAPRIEPLKRIAQGDSNNVSIITLGDHTGTHVDPPLHFIEGGNTVDKLPLDALVLGTVNANAVDFRQGLVDLAAAERRWPGFLVSLITRRVPLERAAEALRHDPAQIKQVVEIRQ